MQEGEHRLKFLENASYQHDSGTWNTKVVKNVGQVHGKCSAYSEAGLGIFHGGLDGGYGYTSHPPLLITAPPLANHRTPPY